MEQAYWWEQVGPRSFFLEVFHGLRSASVIVWFPAHATEDILVPLDEYAPSLAGRIHHIDASEDGTPENLVRNEFPDANPSDNLFPVVGSAPNLLVVRNVRKESWPAWRRFIDDYHWYISDARLHIADASRFLVLAQAIDAEQAPSRVVTVKHLRYQGYVSLSDTERYCQRLLAGRCWSPIERQVAASIIAHLALWDKDIAERLCGRPLSDILDPLKFLQRLAVARKWRSDQPSGWHNGTQHEVESQNFISSAFLALCEDWAEIKQRIWHAQLKVLFPFIEHQRNIFIDMVRQHLSFVPPQTGFAEMEFLALHRLIKNHLPKGSEESYSVFLQIAAAFGNVRNRLAHRSPAPADALQVMFGAIESMNGMLKHGFSAALAGTRYRTAKTEAS